MTVIDFPGADALPDTIPYEEEVLESLQQACFFALLKNQSFMALPRRTYCAARAYGLLLPLYTTIESAGGSTTSHLMGWEFHGLAVAPSQEETSHGL